MEQNQFGFIICLEKEYILFSPKNNKTSKVSVIVNIVLDNKQEMSCQRTSNAKKIIRQMLHHIGKQ